MLIGCINSVWKMQSVSHCRYGSRIKAGGKKEKIIATNEKALTIVLKMQQIKQKIYAEMFVAFLKFRLVRCSKQLPSTTVCSERYSKVFILFIFCAVGKSLNHFLGC